MLTGICPVSVCCLFLASSVAYAEESVEKKINFHIEAQSLDGALQEFEKQAQFVITFWQEVPKGLQSKELKGPFTVAAGLAVLLTGTGVTFTPGPPGVMRLKMPERSVPAGPLKSKRTPVPEPAPSKLPEVLISTDSLNIDQERPADGPQPHIVFDRTLIERSHALTLEDFLQKGLLAHHLPQTLGGNSQVSGETSQLNMLGMDWDNTLILIDGRRVIGSTLGARAFQPDLAAIPLDTVDRVEVLWGTAGRYGGGATAATINIILRRDPPGTRVTVEGERLGDISAGSQRYFGQRVEALPGGRGTITASVGYSSQGDVLASERDFTLDGRRRVEANNPGFLATVGPPLSAQTNVSSVDGTPLLQGGTARSLFIPQDWRYGDDENRLRANEGQFSPELAPTSQLQGGGNYDARGRTEVKFASATSQVTLGSLFDADVDIAVAEVVRSAKVSGADFADLRGITIPADAPTNFFNKPVRVTVAVGAGDSIMRRKSVVGRAMGGLGVQLPREWHARVEYVWSFSDLALERPVLQIDTTAIPEGRVDVLRHPIDEASLNPRLSTLSLSGLRSEAGNALLMLAGPIAGFAAGETMLTFVLEHRREQLVKRPVGEWLLPGPDGEPRLESIVPEQKENIDSAYAEASIPLLKARVEGARPLLEAQLSARVNRYRAHAARLSDGSPAMEEFEYSRSRFSAGGWTTSFTFAPFNSLFFRASCGTGFVPPTVSERTLSVHGRVESSRITDPERGGEPVGPVTVAGGGNPDLEPERSRSWTAGFVFQAIGSGRLRASVDWTLIRTHDVIFLPTQWVFDDFSAFSSQVPGRVVRGPLQPGDPYAVGPVIYIDGSLINLSRTEVEAWHLSFSYATGPLRFGELTLSTWAVFQPVSASQVTDLSPVVNNASIGALAPPRSKVKASAMWEKGRWAFGWTVLYVPHYVVSNDGVMQLNQGARYVKSQDYHDFWGSYALPKEWTLGADVRVQFSAQNVFRSDPPFDAGAPNYFSRHGEGQIPGYLLGVRASF